ncbi:cell division protein FtsQ/DivIB [Stella sp.]|uniref:cell division protein FtsQ/DivIB n=1 Tax=Stella sp. TaxID=2912054 RepID=UPI0035ADE639
MRLLNHPLGLLGQRRDKTGRRVAQRRIWPRWVRPAATAGAALLAVAAVATGWAAWQGGWATRQAQEAMGRFVAATADAGLAVEEILVEGRLHTPRESILAAVDAHRGTPLLSIDPNTVKERLEGLPWIRAAAVERQLPGTLFIRLVERRPMAVWQRRGQLVLIDEQGRELGDEGIEYFPRLPFIVGEDAHRVAADLVAMLAAEPSLRGRVVSAVRVGGRRWNLQLDNGIEIRLPEARAAEAWTEVAAMDRAHRLLSRQITIVDLRDPDRIHLRRAKDAGPGQPGKKDRDV